MAAYKRVKFSSGSKGLDSLVARAQRYPTAVMTDAKLGVTPRPKVLDGCLDLVDRITALSPKSPGADSIPQALTIVWDVYAWLQRDSMRTGASSGVRHTISLDSAFKGLGSGDI
jgi:hypothetical protein